jgi:hypothetical protein
MGMPCSSIAQPCNQSTHQPLKLTKTRKEELFRGPVCVQQDNVKRIAVHNIVTHQRSSPVVHNRFKLRA